MSLGETLDQCKFRYAPSVQIFLSLTHGKLHPTKVLMPFDTYVDYVALLFRTVGGHPPIKFHGADVEMSDSLPNNQIEFQNSVEPTLPELNGRFEIGKDIGRNRAGLPIDWKRVGK